ncbi:MAG: tetraacyldisaccharide 4'-kinase [Moraxella sp.]|nr:tetraacyldisaccharide 4'-kinase [Moraxella sp.]
MKNLELIIAKAWQSNSPYLTSLAPLSAVYKGVSSVRKSLYQNNILKIYHAPVPVLVVGNITVGGSGKTPLIIALVQYLQTKGVSVGVISRGYGGDGSQMPALVHTDSTPSQVGDEPCLIVQSTHVPMAVGANRQSAIELLLQHYQDIQLIISDDGLQHYALHRDAEWIVVDGVRGFGNGKLFPQGFLREPVSRLDGAVVVYHDRDTNKYADTALTMHLEPSPLTPLLASVADVPATTKVYAVTGIGYPARFFASLQALGFDVVECAFADHHEFSLADIEPLHDLPIITTSKDAVKLRTLAKQSNHAIFENIWVLPVSAVLSKTVHETMDNLLDDLMI